MKKYIELFNTIRFVLDQNQFKKVVLLLSGFIIIGVFEILGVISIGPFIGVVANDEIINNNIYLNNIYNYYNFESKKTFLIFLGLITISLVIINSLLNIFFNRLIIHFSQNQGYLIEIKLLKKYLSQEYSFFLNANSSQLTKNMLIEVGRTVGGIIMPSINLLSKSIVAGCLFIFLFILNPKISLIIILIISGVYYLIFNIFKRYLDKIGKSTSDSIEHKQRIISEIFLNIKEIILHSLGEKFYKSYKIFSKKHAMNNYRSESISIIPKYFVEAVSFVIIISVILIFIYQGQEGSYVITFMSVYIFAGFKILPLMQQIYFYFSQIKYHSHAIYNVKTSLKLIDSKKNVISKERFIFKKSFSINGTFEFKSKKFTLTLNNFIIKHNSILGITGPSGSGKSTLSNIILGLIPLKEGKIYIDDEQINNNEIHKWHNLIGYVPQSIYLSDDSIKNNIAFGLNDDLINEEQLINAAKTAEIYDFIMSLPNKFNTNVGEKGIKLSGGQIQRIGIARALYNNPEVLIFDEATSSLDSNTEKQIMESIQTISINKTIVIIAHRLNTLANCDNIIILENGEIIKEGKYSELF